MRQSANEKIIGTYRDCRGMPVGAQQIECPSCGTVVDLSLGDDRTVVDAGAGHREDDAVVNQLCTSCLDKIHVEVG